MSKKDFFQLVYQVVELVPMGRITTYGAVAEYLGSKQSSRMVGWALNASHLSTTDIPAHRVVNRKGLLTGKMHFKGKPMQTLLEEEGIKVIDNQIQNFDDLLWLPIKELEI